MYWQIFQSHWYLDQYLTLSLQIESEAGCCLTVSHCVVSWQAVANESGLNFISVKGPELLNMVSDWAAGTCWCSAGCLCMAALCCLGSKCNQQTLPYKPLASACKGLTQFVLLASCNIATAFGAIHYPCFCYPYWPDHLSEWPERELTDCTNSICVFLYSMWERVSGLSDRSSSEDATQLLVSSSLMRSMLCVLAAQAMRWEVWDEVWVNHEQDIRFFSAKHWPHHWHTLETAWRHKMRSAF